jgi:hypothetical protein
MEDKREDLKPGVGKMHKRRETMADGKRYIIYYTFGGNPETRTPETPAEKPEESENV